MASSRNGKSKSSGLRILWIPGRKRSHPKGRLDSSSKHINYPSRQRKNEMWSLGGSKGQKDLLTLDIDKTFDGPSGSGLSLMPATCTIGAVSCEAVSSKSGGVTSTFSTASTAEILSDDKMPTTIKSSATKTATEDGNKLNILETHVDHDFNLDDLPNVPPKDDKRSNVTIAVENYDDDDHSTLNSKKYRHYNNAQQQSNINSIESLTDSSLKPLHDLAWIDEVYQSADEHLRNGTKKKKKNSHKDKDQLDGIPVKTSNNNNKKPPEDEDDKLVKCLYYTLMCCDCTIS